MEYLKKKGFLAKKLITICLLENSDVTPDFGSSDINKKFLSDFISNGSLIDEHLQIKAIRKKSNS